MRAGRVMIACALAAVLLMGAWGLTMDRPAPPPQDRIIALGLPADRPLRLTVLGTSLSHDEPWTAQLETVLAECLRHPVALSVVARPGAAIDWGLLQIATVAQSRPDLVLVEFAINDADLRDGHGLGAAHRMHGELLTGLRTAHPRTVLYLVTMSPARGLRGLVRPRLGAHYRQYARLAQDHGTGLADLYPRWLALPRSARGLDADGLHPDPQVAAALIVPALADLIARATGQGGCRSISG